MEAKRRILVVDEEPGILMVLRALLVHSGFDVTTASSGLEAVEIMHANQLDVVLLDILMPDLTGLEVLEKVGDFFHKPVIAFSADQQMGELALQMGAADYVAKPFKPDELLEKIDSVMSSDGRKRVS